MDEYQANLAKRLKAMPLSKSLPPWRYVTTLHVGGLFEVGFPESADLLLVISIAGRSVTDCATGTRLARDYTDVSDGNWYDPVRLRAQGIGPLDGQTIQIAGCHGGGLPRVTEDGWSIQVESPDWPNDFVFLEPPGKSIYRDERMSGCCKLSDFDPVLCGGFSWTGQSIVIATSHGADIYHRDVLE